MTENHGGGIWEGVDLLDFLKRMWGTTASGDALVIAADAAAQLSRNAELTVDVGHAFGPPTLAMPPATRHALATGQDVVAVDAADYERRFGSNELGECIGGTVAALPVDGTVGAPRSVVRFSWTAPVRLGPSSIDDLHTIAQLVARFYGRSWSRDQAEQEATRTRAIAALAQALAGAQTVTEMLDFVADQAPKPLGASGAIVGVIDRSNQVMRRYFGEILTGEIADRYRTAPLNGHMPMLISAREGTTLLFPDREGAAASHPELLEAFDAAGYGAFASSPLRDRKGRLFGAIGVGWDQPQTFDDSLLVTLSTVTELVAQTLERTQLAGQLQIAYDRADYLAQFASSLARATTREDVSLAVSDGLLRFARVVDAELHWADPGPSRSDPAPPEPNAAVHALAQAAELGQLAYPLATPDGVHLGTLLIRWTPDDDVVHQVGPTFATGTEMLVSTMQRVVLSTAEHDLVTDLQRRALRLAPNPPGIEIASHYRPAASLLAMGGDWYQSIRLPGDRLGLVVGDLVGHGAEAAIDMTQLSGIIATLLQAGTPLDELFCSVENVVEPLGVMATAVVCEIDPSAQRIRYVSAGHPPLALVDEQGTGLLLGLGRGPMIGVPTPVIPPGEAPFAPGATLLAYTDGLIERRDETLEVGYERVRAALASTAHLPLEQHLASVIEHCMDGRPADDDISALAVRVLRT